MEKEYVPYELALELEQLGFDEYCMHACYYEWKDRGTTQIVLHTPDEYDSHDGVKAPLYQQAFRFFREKYELFHSTNYQDDNSGPGGFDYEILNKRGKSQVGDDYFEFETYEEAEMECLKKLIEIVKTK